MKLDQLNIKTENISGNTHVTFSVKEEIDSVTRTSRYGFRFIPVRSNCKFDLIDGVNISLSTPKRAETFLQVLKQKFPHKKMLHMTITNTEALKNVKKFFTVVYIAKVPYGYGEGYQYHTVITTNDANCFYYKRTIKEPVTIITSATEPVTESRLDVGDTIVCGTAKYQTFLKDKKYSIHKIKKNQYYILNEYFKSTKINLKTFENK